jgi:ABC-type dipeptide/oligopeptide/nickel transport system permease component
VSLGSFILRRLGLGAIAVLGVSVLVFLFLHLIPGDPAAHLAASDDPAVIEKVGDCMGLRETLLLGGPKARAAAKLPPLGPDAITHFDVPIPRQFVRFLGNLTDLSLGHQCPAAPGTPTVMHRVLGVLPYTIELAVVGMLFALILALPLGTIAAFRRGTWIDTGATVFSLAGLSMPIMLLGPVLLYVFFIDLAWLPGPTETSFAAVFLPAFAVAIHLMAMLARMTRSSMVEVLGDDYVRTARAKGLSERVVLGKHALRNALLPVITVAGLQFGSLLSGAIIIEKVFARPGLGLLLLDAIAERNYPVVQGCVIVIAVVYVSVNILVDLAYGLADPRIRRA